MPSKTLYNIKKFNFLEFNEFLIPRAELTINQRFLKCILIFCGQLLVGLQRFLTTSYYFPYVGFPHCQNLASRHLIYLVFLKHLIYHCIYYRLLETSGAINPSILP